MRRALLLLAGSTLAVVLGLPGAAFAAGSGYTPTPPAPTPTVSGVTGAVLGSCTIQPSGGSCTATVNGYTVTVNVAPGTFTVPTQIVISAGTAPSGLSGTVVLTFGVSVVQNGSKFQGSLSPPISVTVTGSGIVSSDQLYVQSGSGFVTTPATVTSGKVTFTFSSDPNYALVATAAPVAATSSAIPGATSPQTGKPFLAEGILAALLVMGGTLFLVRLRLRRA